MNILKIIFTTLISILVVTQLSSQARKDSYQPTFESLEKVNPVPEWFKDAKFGIYFHWGVYSVPAWGNEWYPRNMYFKGSPENKHQIETYGELDTWPYSNFITGANDKKGNFVQFAPKLKSEGGKFDPTEWAQLFADAGAKYAGPVAEHHDGFSMWASKVNPWNAKDMGPKLDLVGMLTEEIRKKDMKIILSMHHAFNITGFFEAVPPTSDPKLQMLYGQQGKEKNEELWLNKHKEIIDMYKPDIIWQDFNLHVISQPVLLQFLSYYYNRAAGWNKEVVATYKDALNHKCAILDYERGGPTSLTDYYWLTDDAISLSSWSFTEGIGYYSKKQILHGFLDRISKNGNLLLNISPKADGSIPQEQKDVLLAMGDWLKKYGEAVYATRVWEKYGEGTTKMGAAHGVFTAPAEGNEQDIRFTRSKDNTTLYAIILGWKPDQKALIIKSLNADRINLKSLKNVSLINGAAGKYLPLSFKQDTTGLVINLPEKTFDEMAYAVKLTFDGTIPALDKTVVLNCIPHYYLVPGENSGNLIVGSGLVLTTERKNESNQWKLENSGKGYYKIINQSDAGKVVACSGTNIANLGLQLESYSGNANQLWKIEESFRGLFKITNKQYPTIQLSVQQESKTGVNVGITNIEKAPVFGWNLMEVCKQKQLAYKPHTIPGTIEAEDFDTGCPGDAYWDKDESNSGGKYRLNEGVDIETCAAGGFNTGWTSNGEWMAYTVTVSKTVNYTASFYIATTNENTKIHIEVDGVDKSKTIVLPNTKGFQNWQTVKKDLELESGNHTIKFFIEEAGSGVNLDKIVFEEGK